MKLMGLREIIKRYINCVRTWLNEQLEIVFYFVTYREVCSDCSQISRALELSHLELVKISAYTISIYSFRCRYFNQVTSLKIETTEQIFSDVTQECLLGTLQQFRGYLNSLFVFRKMQYFPIIVCLGSLNFFSVFVYLGEILVFKS